MANPFWAQQQRNAVPAPMQTYPTLRPPMSYAPTLPGRIIQSPDEIKVNEVPMDGSVGIFPTQNYSEIYAKAWNQQGTIDTIKYIPEQVAVAEVQRIQQQMQNQQAALPEPPPASPTPVPVMPDLSSFKQDILDRLDRLEKMLTQPQPKSIPSPRNNQKPKEET